MRPYAFLRAVSVFVTAGMAVVIFSQETRRDAFFAAAAVVALYILDDIAQAVDKDRK